MIKKKGVRARVQAKARINPLVSRTLSENPDWTEWSPDDLTYMANNNSTPLDTAKLNMSDSFGEQAARNEAVGFLGGILTGIANAVVGTVSGTVAMVAGEPATRPLDAMREINAASSGGDEPETPWDIPGGEEATREAVGGGIAGFVGDVANAVTGAVRTLADPFTAEPPEGAPNFYRDAASLVTTPIFAAADALDNTLPDGYLGGPGPATRAAAAQDTEDDSEIDGAAEPFGANFQSEFAAQATEAEKNERMAARVARRAQMAQADVQEAEAAQKAVANEMDLLRREVAETRVPVERKETSAQRIERILSERPIGTDAQIRESAKEAVSFGLGANQSLPQYVEEIIAKKNAGTMNAGERILLEDLERGRINRAINKLRREEKEMKAAQAAASTPSSNPLTMLANAVVRTVDAAASVVTPSTSASSSSSSSSTPSKWSSATRRSARVAEAKAMQDAYYAGRPEARAQDASRKAKQTQSVERYRDNVAKLDFRGTRNNL